MKHTKGEINLCSDSLGLAQIEGKTIFVVFPCMCNTPKDLALRVANSKELVHRWNAFEEDGLVIDLINVLKQFIDNEKCRFDHHGYCQTHGITDPCRNQIAKDLITKIERT